MRLLLSLLIGLTVTYAGLINAVAVVVEGRPITLLDIDKKQEELRIGKEAAVNMLIDDKIKELKIEELGVNVNEFEVEDRIKFIAQQNSMTTDNLRKAIEAEFRSWKRYKEDIKNGIVNEKLSREVLADEFIKVDEEDIKIYYENNEEMFNEAEEVEVVQYGSSSKEELGAFMSNPLMVSQRIISKEERLVLRDLAPQFKTMLSATKKGEFTTIIPSSGGYFTFFVKEKIGVEKRSFKEVKEKIRTTLEAKNREDAISNYFAKERVKAKIRVVR